ncbi:MAG TPA: CoA transferase, partial [Burkholderiales bacterium]
CERVLERPDLARDPRYASNPKRVAAQQELGRVIGEAFSKLTADALIARLEAAGIANARVNDLRQVWEHAQLRARNRWTEVETPVGPIKALVPPGLSADTARMDPVPALSAHTEAILRELGYDDAALARLRAERAI